MMDRISNCVRDHRSHSKASLCNALGMEEKPTSQAHSLAMSGIEHITNPPSDVKEDLPPHGTQSSSDTTAQMGAAKKVEGWRLVTVEVCLGLGLFFSAMDSSIVSTALVTIGDYFNGFEKIIWIVLAYHLTYMTFAIMWAKLSDLFGRKICVLAAWCVFVAFSLGCGLARSLNQLIAFRALQGLGGGGLYFLGNIVMPESTTNKYFAMMTGAQGAIFAVSSALGPVLGGIIAKQSSWRWIFYMNIPAGLSVTLVLILA